MLHGLHQPGIEPGAQAWEACMLPLHYWCLKWHKKLIGSWKLKKIENTIL